MLIAEYNEICNRNMHNLLHAWYLETFFIIFKNEVKKTDDTKTQYNTKQSNNYSRLDMKPKTIVPDSVIAPTFPASASNTEAVNKAANKILVGTIGNATPSSLV